MNDSSKPRRDNRIGAFFRWATLLAAPAALAVGAAYYLRANRPPEARIEAADEPSSMVHLPGGTFLMGCDRSTSAAERPAHRATVAPFWIDRRCVSHAEFARFVAATSHITTAEQVGYGWALDEATGSWKKLPGATWQAPDGAQGVIRPAGDDPVVLVSWYDASAYARWAGKRLPTEAEWEYAARGGLADADFPWGFDERPGGAYRANYRQAALPGEDEGADGYRGPSPGGKFPANEYGLYDAAGNVWQWCGDWFADDYYRAAEEENPSGPRQGDRRVLRGGSWADGPANLKVWARAAQPPDAAFTHVGFRCAR
jgi:formylglycine-generating enzyme required for sulfatase activity